MHDHHHHEGGVWGRVRAALLPTCREMSRLSSRELDGPLPRFQKFGTGLHLVFCRLCRRYRQQLRWLQQAARQAKPESTVAGRLPQASRERLRRALREGAATAPAGSGPVRPATSPPASHDDRC
jgi:hypothetical protein